MYAEWVKEQDTKQRLANYQRYQDYYDGDTDIKLPEKLKAYIQGKFGIYIDNYCRRVVDIPVAFLSGGDLAVEVSPSAGTLEDLEREAAQPILNQAKEAERLLYQVYKNSSLLRKNLIKALRMQGKKGEFAFKVVVDGDKNEQGQIIGNKQILIKVLRPDIVFPVWSEEDYEEMESCTIGYPRVNALGKDEYYEQVWTKEQVVEYVSETIMISVGGVPQSITNRREISRAPNPYGLIPIVWCKNKEDDRPWGRSDLEDIIPLQDALNKTLTDLVVNADYQAFQRVFLFGVEANVQIEQGPGTLTKVVDPQAKVQTVEPATPDGLLNIFRQIVDEISTLSGIPKTVLNKDENIGNLSGVALKVAFLTLIDVCNEKAALIREALEWVNYIVFVIAKVEGLAPDYTGFETSVILEEGLPTDEAAIIDRIIKLVDAGLMSKETAMKEYGIEDVESELERISTERGADDGGFTQLLANAQSIEL